MTGPVSLILALQCIAVSNLAAVLIGLFPSIATAQELVEIRGVVTRVSDGAPLPDVMVSLAGVNRRAATTVDGRYVLPRVPLGRQVIRFQSLGYAPAQREVEVADSAAMKLDVALEAIPVQLGEIVVEGASRVEEKMLDAASAISVVSPQAADVAATTGQTTHAFVAMPGVDVVQADLHDFKVNTRGFNTPLARTVLVLQDGRDVAVPVNGAQEWAALSLPADEMGAIEFIRGPGSALYGANAYAGVINIVTPQAREVVGTKLRLVGGELATRQGDLRHAGLLAGHRLGYRINAGYARSESWSRSRTRLDRQDFVEEYAPATDSAVTAPAPERVPLKGQARDSVTGTAIGSPDDLIGTYGSARLDWYIDAGGVATLEGGLARVQNSVLALGSGRVQVIDHRRPWARAAWSTRKYAVSAWYTGSRTSEPHLQLGSGQRLEDFSGVYQLEAQYRTTARDGRARIVTGVSLRDNRIDTRGTGLDPAKDDRSDVYYGAYGHAEYGVTRRLRLIGGVRWDDSDLFDARVTPRVGVMYWPGHEQAIRLTLNWAFLAPNVGAMFNRVRTGQQDFSAVESALRASPLGPALDSVPQGALFDNSAVVPVLVIGNQDLVPQKVTSLELGYRGQVSRRLFATLDIYFNRKTDFVTGALPATLTNPNFHSWTAPSAVPEPDRQAVENAVRTALAGKPAEFGLTRLPDGSTAVVFSQGNAGLVREWGVELGVTGWLTREISLSGSYAYFGFDVKEQLEVLEPNTPKHKGTAAVNYDGDNGLQLECLGRFVDGYQWVAGVYRGYVPRSVTADVSAGYRVSRQVRLHAVAIDLFNRRQFEFYGGAVEGRRVVGGVMVNF